jgi:DNA-binding CsgD family transcriptional regulator
MRSPQLDLLTEKKREALDLVLEWLSSTEIAQRLRFRAMKRDLRQMSAFLAW